MLRPSKEKKMHVGPVEQCSTCLHLVHKNILNRKEVTSLHEREQKLDAEYEKQLQALKVRVT